MKMQVVRGSSAWIEQVAEIYRLCTDSMRAAGIYQWDEGYPNRETAEMAVEARELYLIEDDGQVFGSIIINEDQSQEYEWIRWDYDARPAVLHTLAVHPGYQGLGIARRLVEFAEQYAQGIGCGSIRLDTFSGNDKAMRLYETSGYTCKGAIKFDFKPQPHVWYIVYEKLL